MNVSRYLNRSFMKGAFLLLVGIFSVDTLALPTSLTLPEPQGAYGVGTANVELSDPARTQLRSREKRRWMVTVFYPTLNKGTAPYRPGTLEEGYVGETKVLGHAVPNTPLMRGSKFPVILSFPGRGKGRQDYTILYESLASQGYIVLAMDQPYGANFVKFPTGEKITLTLKDAWNLPRNRDYRYAYDDEMIASALKDIDFVWDHFQDFGDLSRAFDKTKVILMGHSIGANIAHIKGFHDKRFHAVVDMDSKITERALFGHLGVPPNPEAKPVLFIRGMLQYQEEVGDQLTKIANSTLWSPKVQHSAFSDDAYFAAKIPSYGMSFGGSFYNWLFKKGPFFSSTDTNLGNNTVDEWFKQYPEYVVKWLNKVVAKDLNTE